MGVLACGMVASVLISWQAAGASGPAQARQWRVFELTFRAGNRHEGPARGVRLSATFAGPGGLRYAVGGFWDGEETWRVRFVPTQPGEWTYRTSCSDTLDAGLHDRRGRFDVAGAAGANPLYAHGGFLKVSRNARYLTYSDGEPFFWLGDTWWFCPSDLVPIDRSNRPDVPSMYRHLIDTRKEQGFSVVHMAFLGGRWTELAEGRVDLDYWRKVDRYFAYANDAGIVPVFGLGFHQGLNALTLDQLKRIWEYVLARLGAYGCTFLICGEYNQAGAKDADGKTVFGPQDAQRVAKLLALGAFIKQTDPYRRAMTVHPWWYAGEKRQAWSESWYDFILLQGGHGKDGPAPGVYLDVYRRRPAKPLLEGECTYEGIHGFDASVVRHNAYKAIQCGSFGFTYGSHGLWYPNQDANDLKFSNWGRPVPWWVAMKRPGAAQMKHLRACYESVRWWRLEPRPDAIRADRSQPAPSGILAKADGDEVYVLYYPANRPADAKARLLARQGAGPFSGTWFDPRSGQATALPGTIAPDREGLGLPTPPDREDWVLILRRRPS